MQAKRIRHMGIITKDLECSINFYTQLGFRKTYQKIEEWGNKSLVIVKMDLGGQIIELIKGDWMPHIALEVDDLYGCLDAPMAKVDKIANVIFTRDPDGNWLELVRLNR